MNTKEVFYLPSGRIFVLDWGDGLIECTEMRDVTIDGKIHAEVRQTQDPHVIWKHLVPYRDKWLLTVSTQKGCSFNCCFCDVANLPFRGNLSQRDIEEQVRVLLEASPYVRYSNKVKIGFARMGEPALNLENVRNAMVRLPEISREMGRDFKWLPCFNSILPRGVDSLVERIVEIKERDFRGFLHFQVSCNSTDEEKRRELFGGANVLSLEEVVGTVNRLNITSRTVTLNFIVMKGVEVDVQKLKKLGLSADKFAVKLIPLNNTVNGEGHDLETVANYNNYEDLLALKDEFEKEGVPVVVDAIARCEEAGLCCGQLASVFVA